MSKSSKTWAIVPAAGIGLRMNREVPKQYEVIGARTVLHHTLVRLCENSNIHGIVVGLSDQDELWAENPFWHKKFNGTFLGGINREDTVLNGLEFLQNTLESDVDDWALVHDAARPCIIQADIDRIIEASRLSSTGAVLGSRIRDTMKQCADNHAIERTVDRNFYWRAFTPQIFKIKDLASAIQQAKSNRTPVTDESMAMALAGFKPMMVQGHPSNIKITVEDDLEIATTFLEKFK
jgi:2-C-methyl-D-erythritol 4-phosphate cytidylyltransferase